MKKLHLSFMAILSLCSYSHTSSPQLPQGQTPVVINFSNYADANAQANPQLNNKALQEQKQQNTMNVSQVSEYKLVHVHSIDLNLTKSLEQLAESCKQKGSSALSLLDTLIEHKEKAIVGILGACYGYLYYKLHEINNILNKSTSWCNWKQTVVLQHLTAAKYDDLIQELFIDMQKKYLFSSDNKAQVLTHEQFIQELAQEKKALQNYQYILSWAQSLYVSKILPLQFTQDIITEKLARLDVVIDLFSIWQSKQLCIPAA